MIPSLDEVNGVLSIMREKGRFDRRKGRLWYTNRHGTVAAVNGRTGWYPAWNYGRFGMGGTSACATMQLAHWARGKPRVPVSTWEYWFGPKIMLGDAAVLERLKDSSYGDPAMTCCVLCGNSRIGDWWSNDKLIGPCCWGAPQRCNREGRS